MITELITVILIELIIVLGMYIVSWIASLMYSDIQEAKAVLSYDEFKELIDDKDDKD